MNVFEKLLQFEKEGKIDSGLDYLFDTVEDLLIAGEFKKVDDMLGGELIWGLGDDFKLGFVNITRPFKNRLNNRESYCNKLSCLN